MKRCSECGKNKKEECFYKNKRGYFTSPLCRQCMSKKSKIKYKEAKKTEIYQKPILTYKQAKELYESIYA